MDKSFKGFNKIIIKILTEDINMRIRGDAVVLREGKLLLVRDKGEKNFSIPGGGAYKKEPSLAASVRELYEELKMTAFEAKRLNICDYKGHYNKHEVVLIKTHDEPVINSKELDEFIWWNMKDDIRKFPHVDYIAERLNEEYNLNSKDL
jgi:predicted NUDIX family NTP pyrophosphohydrolase